jgi:hypothetical protein
MAGLRVRLAPAWIRARWPKGTRAALAVTATVVIVAALLWLPGGGHPVRCHPDPGRATCR